MTRTLKAGWPHILAAALAWGALFGIARAALGQDAIQLEIKGDVQVVKVKKYIEVLEDRTVVNFTKPLVITAPKSGILYQWSFPAGVTALRKANVLEVTAAPKGAIVVSVEYAIVDFDKKTVETKFGSISFDVGEPGPQPVPVPPIDPKPIPPVTPAPIPLPGLRVLIIHETEAGPPGVNLIISGEKVRNYMAEKGAKGGFLALDKDLTPEQLMAAGQEPWVVEAFKRPRTTLPWVVISNGVTGFEGPLPTTNAPTDALNLIKKIGG